jgi:hypothetical protein
MACFQRVEEFCKVMGFIPEVEHNSGDYRLQNIHAVRRTHAANVTFATGELRRKWIAEGKVDFLELYCGCQELTFRIREAGLIAGDGIDSRVMSYDQTWPLDDATTRMQLAWLIVFALEPLVIHTGTPCTNMCVLGSQDTDKALVLVKFTALVADHQDRRGYLASDENPAGSLLQTLPAWQKVFGRPPEYKGRWRCWSSDGCQLGMVYPGVDDPGRPMRKTQEWGANFDLSPLCLKCRKPEALVGASHDHKIVRGSMKLPDGHWSSVAEWSGRYPAEQSTVYARCVRNALAEVERKPLSAEKSNLQRLAEMCMTSCDTAQHTHCGGRLAAHPQYDKDLHDCGGWDHRCRQ